MIQCLYRLIPTPIKILLLLFAISMVILFAGVALGFLLNHAVIEQVAAVIAYSFFVLGGLATLVWHFIVPSWVRNWLVAAAVLFIERWRPQEPS